MLTVFSRRAPRAAALALTALAAAACGNDVTESDEPSIAAVQLTITPASGAPRGVYITRGATVTPVPIPLGASTVTAELRDASNNVITPSETFQLRFVSTVTSVRASDETALGGVITFVAGTGAGGLTGRLNASTSATVPGYVRLVHVDDAHSDFDQAVTIVAAQ